MTAPVLTRAVHRSRLRRTLWLGGGLCVLALGAVIGRAITPADHELHIVPVVTRVAVAPTPVTLVAPPAVAPMEPVEPPSPIAARATSPMIHAACLLTGEDEEPSPSCEWDDGFPAVSADGTRVATAYVPDDGGRGYPGLSIHIIDVRTSRRVRELLVLSPDEYDGGSEHDGDRARLRATVERRAAVAQRVLDAGRFRTLEPLGSRAFNDDETETDRTRVHAEVEDDRVRAIDPATGRVLWQHRFAVPAPRAPSDEDDCSGWSLHQTSVWWDPTTAVVLATQAYATGGCICAVVTHEHVRRISTASAR